jgi:hypothetical protein
MDSRLISIVCGSGLIVATSGVVFAADMAVKAPPPPAPAVWDWSGFYIGVGGSFNWTHFDQSLQGVSGVIIVLMDRCLSPKGKRAAPFSISTETKETPEPTCQASYGRCTHSICGWAE